MTDPALQNSGPLAGVRVADLTVNVLGPLCTQTLGDMGANVVKIEPPEGDPMRNVGPARHPGMAAFFLNLNRNKRSITLDLKSQADRETLLRIVDCADVFVHAMRPAAARRLGIDYGAISARNPRIIYASSPGFRQDGPLKERPAFDDIIQGMTGIPALYRLMGEEPTYVPTVIVDKLIGLVMASAIGMALYYRERSGRGQEIQVPMLETMMSFNLTEHLMGSTFDPPEGPIGYARLLTKHRRPYRTLDGHICVMAHSDEQWKRFFDALGRSELAADPRFRTLAARSANIDDLYAIVAAELETRTTRAWQGRFDTADIPNAPPAELVDVRSDPYLSETGFFQPMAHPTEGPMVTMAIGAHFSASAPSVRLPPPRLGEHTQEVLDALARDAVGKP